MLLRRISLPLFAAALCGCKGTQTAAAPLPTAEVSRGDIAVRVQATGTVEPIDTVAVKSKANGMVIQLPVEVGSVVKKGALLAQVDPRDVKNEFDQAVADDVVSAAGLHQAMQNQTRTDSLFARHVITVAEHDSSKSTTAAAVSDMVNSRANLDLARQKLEDATVLATIDGTVISRPATQGTIITSATSANGGTTLMTLADLGRVRFRVTIDEVEMANVRVGEAASVNVDAFADHPFDGIVEKIEPQAVVTQGVTVFPVLVSVNNKDGLLMPGMNGEVTIKAADLSNVVQLPIDAIRPTNELAAVARMFKIPIDTLTNVLRRDLTAGEGTTGIPGRYVVVAQADGSYQMRLVKVGPTDLRVTEVLDGVKPGDKVVLLGSILTGRTAPPPRLEIAANMKRAPNAGPSTAATSATATTAATVKTTTATTTGAPASQAGKPGEARKASKP
jgi:HlyD family secretion protein